MIEYAEVRVFAIALRQRDLCGYKCKLKRRTLLVMSGFLTTYANSKFAAGFPEDYNRILDPE